MGAIRTARRGAACLLVLAFLTGCATHGSKPATGPAIETRVVEAAKQQLVPISSTLTQVDDLPPLPMPAVPAGADCARPLGCYSNQQLQAALDAALAWGGKLADNLRAIRRAGEDALKSKDPAP